MLKINNDTNRLTLEELNEYETKVGLTALQFIIIKKRYYDPDQPTVVKICSELHISERKYNRELNKALNQIYKYETKK